MNKRVSPWSSPKAGIVTCGIVLGILVSGSLFLYARHNVPLVDEGVHSDQVYRFLQRTFDLNPKLTTFPVYHLIIAGMVSVETRIPGFPLDAWHSLALLRANALFWSLLCVMAFFLVTRIMAPTVNAPLRTLQFLLLPLIFPYLFLLYTDASSLFFILVALGLIAKKHYHGAGLAGAMSVLIRQNAIVWLPFLLALTLISVYEDLSASSRSERSKRADSFQSWQRLRPHWKSFLIPSLTFLAGGSAFVLFLLSHGGIAIGDPAHHPFPSFSTGNIFFLLFLVFLFFLPLCITSAPEIWRLLKRRNTQILLFLLLILFWFTFEVSHSYNISPGIREFWSNFDTFTFLRTGEFKSSGGYMSVFLRNNFLAYVSTEPIRRTLFFLAGACGAVFLAQTQLQKRLYWLFAIFAVLSLLPSWLIEQRYYFVPFTLFLLWRKEERIATEVVLLLFWAGLSLLLFDRIASGAFFF